MALYESIVLHDRQCDGVEGCRSAVAVPDLVALSSGSATLPLYGNGGETDTEDADWYFVRLDTHTHTHTGCTDTDAEILLALYRHAEGVLIAN